MIFLIFFMIATAYLPQVIPNSPKDVVPIEVGESIPNVTLRDAFGHKTDLNDLVSEKPTLLIFYRGGWCPYCNKHLSSLAEIEDEVYEMGIQIIAISPDKPSYLKETIMDHDLDYRLLSDSDMRATTQFGLAYKVDQKTLNRYKKYGLDLAERSGYDHHMLPVPAAFLVDTDGTIKYRYFNPDYTIRVSTDELLRVSKDLMAMKKM